MTECGCRLDADEVKGDAASSIDELGARRSSRQPALHYANPYCSGSKHSCATMGTDIPQSYTEQDAMVRVDQHSGRGYESMTQSGPDVDVHHSRRLRAFKPADATRYR